ncbi:hypothetical protein [Candidatus Enterovibrio altilux]|uniref:Uncharacterized protein n=1 Tax=Candidatus Enterovibrio altilux TaxID=1927128 RepID=A0A291B7X7_9GAMM|nr:hypothetical protein [Candidatus Enterovibrio luxaltus]ATF09101.1 hypothetical protein BTN50_0574 [Candidatus Enterovibrio luxaltus]
MAFNIENKYYIFDEIIIMVFHHIEKRYGIDESLDNPLVVYYFIFTEYSIPNIVKM